mmetsp:Transcript_10631/g.9610  ORF Transcript_10631/g.9610 Transcript_10631/m.9610 type:complete len:184 (+) Transcript_10631:123-674(+)
MLYLLPVLLFAYVNAEGPGCNSVVLAGAYGYPTDECITVGSSISAKYTCADDDTITFNAYADVNDCSGDPVQQTDYCADGLYCTGYCGQSGTCGIITAESYEADDCSGDVLYSQPIITDYCGGLAKFECNGGTAEICINSAGSCDSCTAVSGCQAGTQFVCDSSGAELKLFVAVIAVFIASLF